MSNPLTFEVPIYVLAPLAGFTDLPLRSVVKKFGADLTVSEMLSANALAHHSAKTFKMIEKSPLENPYSVQIAGADVDAIRAAVEILNTYEGIDVIDLNIGCPVPKVVAQGAGSGLLNDLDTMQALLRTIKATSTKRYTSAKMRIGFGSDNGVDIAKRIEDSGVDFLAVHGRTRAGKFKAQVDYDSIARIKAAVSIPVIANGDIDSYEKAQYVLAHTQCDGVMIGRAAVGSPWIFYQLKHGVNDVSMALKQEIIIEHYDKMIEVYGAHGAVAFRKQLHSYSKGLKQASHFRDQVNRMSDPIAMRDYIVEYFSPHFQES
ncbi:MAG: tRNA-dihydrouridine synthase [Sulfuricurvum sp. PC08-66]|nr:MAG: tRNA-dihydrouridine synthase [Sulfuricurvum sp. PC08-66]